MDNCDKTKNKVVKISIFLIIKSVNITYTKVKTKKFGNYVISF